MTKQEIIDKVKGLNLSKGNYIVFGSCPLAVANIREAKDIDLLVSEKVYAELKSSGWKELKKAPDDIPLTHGVFEAHSHWNFSPNKPTLERLLKTADWIEDLPFASLQEVREWKVASGGAKHLADVALIDKYLKNQLL